MTSQRKQTRGKKQQNGGERHIKEKFQEERNKSIRVNPIKPMNTKQAHYMELLLSKPVVIATGYPGTSKSYLPAAIAADRYREGQINKIFVTRPAISSSKSVGYTSGSFTEKMKMWLGAVLPVFKERLGGAALEIAIESGDFEFIPLETVKGMSINNAWLIVEEASDLTIDEVKKLVTRMGKNSTLVLAGDIRQAELKGDLGLAWLVNFIHRHNLQKNFGFVDFNEVNDIVRSEAVKQFITCVTRDEKKGIV